MQTQIFPPKEVAMELKRVEFNEECVGWYDMDNKHQTTMPFLNGVLIKNEVLMDGFCSAPTYDQVIGWFAEVHGISIVNMASPSVKHFKTEVWQQLTNPHSGRWVKSRQQSLLTAFREAIKLIQP